MATAREIFLTPDPNGDGFVERVGVTESRGDADAGRLVAAGADGRVGESLLPYAGAPDMAAEEYDAGAVLAQASTVSGRSWRWLGLSSLSGWVVGRVMDMVAPVGTVRQDVSAADTDYWLFADGRHIGPAGSGAALSGDRYRSLFVKLWSAFSATHALPVYNSAGQSVVRGATALEDWSAGRRIALPDLRNRVLAGAGLDYALGQTGGAARVALIVDELPSHDFSVATAQTGAVETIEFVTNASAGTTVTSTPRNIEAVSVAQTQIESAATGSHTHVVAVTVQGSRAEPHKHPVTVNAGGGGTHDHEAVTDVEVTMTAVDPGVEPAPNVILEATASTDVESATIAPHVHGAETDNQTTPTATHGHTATGTCQANDGGTGHGHTARTSVQTQVSFGVTSTASTTLNLSKASKTITTVGSGTASTNRVGGNAAHENMPPYFGVAALIRY